MAPFGENLEQWVEMGEGKVRIEMASMVEEKLEMGGGEVRKEMLSLEEMALSEGGKGIMKEMASKEEKLEMAHEGKDRTAMAAWEEKLEPACAGRGGGGREGVGGLKRVMSEASFMRVQGLATSNGDGSYNYNNTKTYGLMSNNGSSNEPRDEEEWEEEGAMAAVGKEEVSKPVVDVKKMVAQQQLEVTVACECCGMSEECTLGYIDRVKGLFSGRWICGLCAEAVQEERHRLGRGSPMEEAVRAHMNLCSQFSAKKVAGPPPGVGVAHAVCHLLRRHLSDPTRPRSPPSPSPSPPPSPGTNRRALCRTSSCRPFFSNRS